MTRQQRERRLAMASTAIGLAILVTVLMILPAIGGMLTAEQPVSTHQR